MINKIKQNMVFSLALLITLALGMMPNKSYAQSRTCNENGCVYVFTSNYSQPSSPTPTYTTVQTDNPIPVVNSISPKSSNVGVGAKTITITGEGFIPSSIARVNGSNRATTFIDSSHLLMQITGNDTYLFQTNSGFYITVFNGAPNGGYSNAVFFTVNKPVVSSATTTNTQNNNSNNTSTNFTDAPNVENSSDAKSDNNLAANAIFGSNSFTPSGLIQWIFFAIIVLLIVILVRKIFGGKEKYLAIPMKHD